MHSALFVATIPPETGDWCQFLDDARTKLERSRGAVRLAENVWLLNFQASPAALGWLIALAEQKAIAYGVLPFEREPQWLPAGFDPETISARNEDR